MALLFLENFLVCPQYKQKTSCLFIYRKKGLLQSIPILQIFLKTLGDSGMKCTILVVGISEFTDLLSFYQSRKTFLFVLNCCYSLRFKAFQSMPTIGGFLSQLSVSSSSQVRESLNFFRFCRIPEESLLQLLFVPVPLKLENYTWQSRET